MAKVKVRRQGEHQARVDTLSLLFAYVLADGMATDDHIDAMMNMLDRAGFTDDEVSEAIQTIIEERDFSTIDTKA